MSNRPEDLDIWVLAGQSNMQGSGALNGYLLPDERVWNFTMAGNWEIANEPMHRLWESFAPVNQTLMRPNQTEEMQKWSDQELAEYDRRTITRGSGLGLSFGISKADALKKPIGLISAAHGGTSLTQWSSKLKDKGVDSLYGAMLERIKRAGGNLKGVLWYQGENDALSMEDGLAYADRLSEWISDLRSDLNMPELPVIVVQLGRLMLNVANEPAWDLVREALYNVPNNVPHTAVTSAIDLSLEDYIHISTKGLIRLGSRMARLALGMNTYNGPRVERIERLKPDQMFQAESYLRVVTSGVTGSWNPDDNIRGFQIYSKDNLTISDNAVCNAFPDPSDSKSILIRVYLPVDDDMKVGYGLGFNPCCNAVDSADMPLCTFLPRSID